MRAPRSPRDVRLDVAAILCLCLIGGSACASPVPPASAAAAAPSAAAPTSSSSAPVGSPGGAAISDADRAALADPTLGRLREYEALIDAAIAERSGQLAILGPEGVAWLAQDRSRAIKVVLDAHKVKYAERRPQRLTSTSMARVGDAVAIAIEPAFGAIFTAGALVGLRMDLGFGGAGPPGQPSTSTSSGQQTVGSHRISTTTTTTTILTWSGSTVIADVTLNQAVTIADATTGAVLGTTTNKVHVHAEGNGCPDAAGIALVKFDVEISGDASGMAGGSLTEMRSQSETQGHVGDDAELGAVDDQSAMTYTTTTAGTRRTSTARIGLSLPANVTQQIDDGDVPPAEAATARGIVLMLTAMMARAILTLAEGKWQGGACVRIDATTAKVRLVAPRKVVAFTAKPVHIIEGTDLDKPIFATFSGDGTLAPVNTEERPPPVSYTFTAPSQKDKTGTALLKSTSNRGIGRLEIVFRTEIKGWKIDQASGGGSIIGQHCGSETGQWVAHGTYDQGAQQGKQKWVMRLDGSTMKGTYTYTDNAVQNIVVEVLLKGSAKGNVTFTIDDDGRVLMHLQETKHTYQTTVPAYPAAWGRDQNAPLVDYDMAWEIDETCP